MTRNEAIRFLADNTAFAAITKGEDPLVSSMMFTQAMVALGVDLAELGAIAERAVREFRENLEALDS